MDLGLKGRVVVVTGAGQGNGAAIARAFAQEGARVAVVDRNLATATDLAHSLRSEGGETKAFEVDVADAAQCWVLASSLLDLWGPAQVLVNNAGILVRGSLSGDAALADWTRTLGVNLDGPFHMTLAFLEQLKSTKGCILNVASIQSFIARPNSAAYTASKGGVAQLTKAMACELAEFGVRVNAIAPGVIATPMTVDTLTDPEKVRSLTSRVPLKRHGEAAELAGPSLFLCSHHASYITGAILPVDGGYLCA
jgi:NAD(P)-dependent dehydrogenase (short-subunit alcohol dehydrogenase family)